jgi:hypothetical protein
MFRVGLYARVYTHDQKTLPLQIRNMREYAAKRGWVWRASRRRAGKREWRRAKSGGRITSTSVAGRPMYSAPWNRKPEKHFTLPTPRPFRCATGPGHGNHHHQLFRRRQHTSDLGQPEHPQGQNALRLFRKGSGGNNSGTDSRCITRQNTGVGSTRPRLRLARRRITTLVMLQQESAAWNSKANRNGTQINWQLTRKKARVKFGYQRSGGNRFTRSKTWRISCSCFPCSQTAPLSTRQDFRATSTVLSNGRGGCEDIARA